MIVEIGGLPILLRAGDPAFIDQAKKRYAGFISPKSEARFEFDVELASPGNIPIDEDASVEWDSGKWLLQRGDFRAEWDPKSARGVIRQTANPYSLDSVLRIVHTLLLANEGGFLLHASSAIRNGRASLFSGVSGAGKTTMARLAPPDAQLLTDEISYVTRRDGGYRAFGTPFAGDLGRAGENAQAPVEVLYLLAQGPENSIESLDGAEAVRRLLENILFFAKDSQTGGESFPISVRFYGARACAPAYVCSRRAGVGADRMSAPHPLRINRALPRKNMWRAARKLRRAFWATK